MSGSGDDEMEVWASMEGGGEMGCWEDCKVVDDH